MLAIKLQADTPTNKIEHAECSELNVARIVDERCRVVSACAPPKAKCLLVCSLPRCLAPLSRSQRIAIGTAAWWRLVAAAADAAAVAGADRRPAASFACCRRSRSTFASGVAAAAGRSCATDGCRAGASVAAVPPTPSKCTLLVGCVHRSLGCRMRRSSAVAAPARRRPVTGTDRLQFCTTTTPPPPPAVASPASRADTDADAS